MISRRAFLAGGAGLGGATPALLGCGGDEEPAPTAFGSTAEQIDLLNDSLEVERGAVVAYKRAAELLDGEELEAVERFEGQEREHADALVSAIDGLGGTPVAERDDGEYVRELELDELETADEMLRFAAEIEYTEIGGFADTVARIAAPAVRRTIYETLAVDAAQLAVILGALGEVQVPGAFGVGVGR